MPLSFSRPTIYGLDAFLVFSRHSPGKREEGKEPVITRFSLEQADAGRDCRAYLARPTSQARTGTGKIVFLSEPIQLTTSRIGNHNTG